MAVAQTSKTADRSVLRIGGLAVMLAGLLAITLWLGTATPLTAGILSPEDTSIYRRAFSSADKRKWRTALGLAGQAKDSVLREVVYWRYYRDTQSGAVFQDISRFMATHQSWPGMAGLKLAGEMAIDATVGDDAVLAWFAHHGRPNTLQGAERLAKALIQQGRPNEANGMLRRIWIELNFNLRDEKRFLARHSHLVNAAIHDARLERLLHDKQRKQIRRQIKRVTPEIRSLYRLRKNLRRNLPQSLHKIKLLPHRLRYHQGLLKDLVDAYAARSEYGSALEVIRNLPEPLARPVEWAKRRALVGRLSLRDNNPQLAYEAVAGHGLSEGIQFDRCEFLAGWISYRFFNDPARAYRHFTKLYHGLKTSISISRAAYWAGRVSESVGKNATALGWYRIARGRAGTFYGQLASEKLNGVRGASARDTLRSYSRITKAFPRDPLVAVMRRLQEVRPSQIFPFFHRMLLDAPSDAWRVQLVGFAHELGRPDLALQVARKIQANGSELVDQGYPIHALPDPGLSPKPEPALVLAVIRQESAFNPSAISPSGARGLMQLMPPTARRMARNIGVKYRKSRLTSDPNYNMRLGQAYLSHLLKRFDGSYLLTLASYNAGPSRVEDWIDTYGDPRDLAIDPIDWIEILPFNETRNYVKRVLEATVPYRNRLAGRPVNPRAANHTYRR